MKRPKVPKQWWDDADIGAPWVIILGTIGVLGWLCGRNPSATRHLLAFAWVCVWLVGGAAMAMVALWALCVVCGKIARRYYSPETMEKIRQKRELAELSRQRDKEERNADQ